MGLVFTEELARVERVVDNIEDLEKVKGVVAEALDGEDHPETLERLERVQDRELGEAPDVRVSVVARLLDLSVPTVGKWLDLGLLENVEGHSHRRVSTRSVLAVRPHVLALRDLGKKRNLLEAVLARVEDEELLANPRIRASLASAKQGRLTDITPND